MVDRAPGAQRPGSFLDAALHPGGFWVQRGVIVVTYDAWLTEDMLKSAIRQAGIAVRVK